MTWWKPWSRLKHNGHADREAERERAEAERVRRNTQRMRGEIERMADRVADLPDDELVARVARMLRARPS